MDKNFFKKTRILDGGMGQELLNRGVKPYGTIWGASALLKKATSHPNIEIRIGWIGIDLIDDRNIHTKKHGGKKSMVFTLLILTIRKLKELMHLQLF